MVAGVELQRRLRVDNPGSGRKIAGLSPNPHEGIIGGPIEITRGDPQKDALALAGLFVHPAVIGHLSGIAPPMTAEQEAILRAKNPTLKKILVASPENLQDYLAGSMFLVARHQGRVIGSVAVEGSGLGVYGANVAKLVVHPDYQGQKTGEALLRSAERYIFTPSDAGGLGCDLARATVIYDVAAHEKPFFLFLKEQYTVLNHPYIETCASWDSFKRRFIRRKAISLILPISDYKTLNKKRGSLEQDFPRHSFGSLSLHTP